MNGEIVFAANTKIKVALNFVRLNMNAKKREKR